MDFDPLELATTTRDSYAEHYAGSLPSRAAKDLAARYKDGTRTSLTGSLSEFTRTKGPYLQVLDLPRISDTPWEKFATSHGFHSDLIQTFTEVEFQSLFEFQERSVEAILEDDHTLLTASTGRGKTEGWLIPILQYIIEAKDGKHDAHPPESVKCILTYPTKALAQDQLKRLIDYLFILNRDRQPEDQITVGIYDGDTKRRDPDELSYLQTTFQYFDCPCGEYDSSLTVRQQSDGSFLVEPLVEHDKDLSFEFIKVTRDAIVETPADILLTNPNTINYRLFNVNEQDEQHRFVAEPKFFVFDEIHEYSELFGSFTSALMRRYIRERQELNGYDSEREDDLTIIGASATVENKRTVFQRINPFVDPAVTVVEENERTIDSNFPQSIPREFRETELTEESVYSGTSDASRMLLDEIGMRSGDDPDSLGNALYEHLVEGRGGSLEFVRGIYAALHDTPLRPDELHERLVEEARLSDTQAEVVVANFMTIGEMGDILERRAHLFSWPLDGYYTCLNCSTVYDTPQSTCSECGHHFVTKLSLCTKCGEESLESWFCPHCERLIPHTVTSQEGRFEYFERRECQCETVEGETPEMVRVYWRPFYECTGCGERQKLDHLHDCPKCGSGMIHTDSMETYVCTNPKCENEITTDETSELTCQSCHDALLEPLVDEHVQYCPDCGDVYEDLDGQNCPTDGCDGELTPKRFLGWTCGDPACNEVYLGRPPRTCACGKQRFVRSALFDIRMVDECQSCGQEFLPNGEHRCGCESPEIERRARGYKNFRMVDDNGRLREASHFAGALPCYHPDQRETYSKYKRYDSMLRGPANAAVTMSRYLLRSLADRDDPETFKETKLLSFADSQSDMKELERNFREPEEPFFFDRLLLESIQTEAGSSGWALLSEVIELGRTEALEYESELAGETDRQPHVFDNLTGYNQTVEAYLTEELVSRVFQGKYSNRYRNQQLTTTGLIDVRLTLDIEELSDQERMLFTAAIGQNHHYEPSLLKHIEEGQGDLESLLDMGYLRRIKDDGTRYIMVSEDIVECAIVNEETPTFYSPHNDQFVTSLERNFGEVPTDIVSFAASPEDRSEFSHPHFSLTAQQVCTGDPMMLLARAYYGQTDREQRRKLEYQFRQGRYPHFLSSGPAMELGVDIGDLNTLLLYGTPPNANSYLQRVGRAGRASGNSLVHSVSQRNPIDYYYHEHPSELISAEPTPVPLNEVNHEVLRQSLTWAVLDWITTTYWIPWRREASGFDDLVVCKDDAIPRSDPRPNDVLQFTALLASTNFQVQHEGEEAPLAALRTLIEENKDEVRMWLQDVIRFGVCSSCGRKHESGYNGSCTRPSCDGTVESVLEEYGDIVDVVLGDSEESQSFESTVIDLYNKQVDNIDDDLMDYDDQIVDLRREARGVRDREQKHELREKRKQIQRRADQLDDYIRRLDRMDFGRYLNQESSSAFGLRSVGGSVSYRLVGEDFEAVSDGSRDRRISLRELHPGAAYLHDSETFVVTEVYSEPLETHDITEKFPDEAICPTCATEYDSEVTHCPACGTRTKRLRTIVPERVVAYQYDLPITTTPNAEQLNPGSIYQGSERIQGTYAPVEADAGDSFDPSLSYDIIDESGTVHGQFEYGDVTMVASTDQYWATYKGSGRDPLPNTFEMCSVDGCNGMIANVGDSAYCTKNIEHPANESESIRLATQFDTKSVRVLFDDEKIEHGFVHGLRVALQYIGGVSVRQIPESIENEGTLVYDSDEGGSGITVLLTEDDGEKFKQATELMRKAFADGSECNCENGCPFCLYQYGCIEQNDPHSFDKGGLLDLLAKNLHLELKDDD